LKLTAGLGLTEAGIKMFENIDWNEQRVGGNWTGNCGAACLE